MTETLDLMAATEVDQKQLAEQLLAQAKEQGVELMGPNGLLNQLTKSVLETVLDAEMTEHLGYEKPNRRRALRAHRALTGGDHLANRVTALWPRSPGVTGVVVTGGRCVGRRGAGSAVLRQCRRWGQSTTPIMTWCRVSLVAGSAATSGGCA